VTCACHEQKLDVFINDKEFNFSFDTQGIFLYSEGKNVKAEIKQFVTLETQIMLEGLNLVSTYDKSRCYIEFKKLEGCYTYYTGDNITIKLSHRFWGDSFSY